MVTWRAFKVAALCFVATLVGASPRVATIGGCAVFVLLQIRAEDRQARKGTFR